MESSPAPNGKSEIAVNKQDQGKDILAIRQERISAFYSYLDEIDISRIKLSESPAVRIATKNITEVTRNSSREPTSIVLYFENGRTVALWDFEDLESFFEEYQDYLQKILDVPQRQLSPDRRVTLIENLERRRESIHNNAAQTLVELLKKSEVTTDLVTARIFIKVLHQLWLLETLLQEEVYGDNFGTLDIDEIKARVRERFGLELEAMKYQGGYHDEEPYFYYHVTLKGQEVKAKRSHVREYIESEIQKRKVSV